MISLSRQLSLVRAHQSGSAACLTLLLHRRCLSNIGQKELQKPNTEVLLDVDKIRDIYLPSPGEEDSRPVVPVFWTGSNHHPEKEWTVDCYKLGIDLQACLAPDETGSGYQVDTNCKAGERLYRAMMERYGRLGFVKVANTGLSCGSMMKAVTQLIQQGEVLYEGGANPRDSIPEANVYDTGAPLTAYIHYHHEMAYVEESVRDVGFVCLENTNPGKGHTFLADNVAVTDFLDRPHPELGYSLGEKLRSKGLCYVRKLPDMRHFHDKQLDPSIVYNFWQQSFLTGDPMQAEHTATTQKNLHVQWEDSPVFGRYMVTRHYCQAYEWCPFTNRNLVFSSIADDYMWFDSWRGVMALPHQERPLKLNFGNGEVMTRQEKQVFVDAYDSAGTRIEWNQGDCVVACNYRTAHGRPAVHLEQGEKRELGVVLGKTLVKTGVKEVEEKWKPLADWDKPQVWGP